MILLVYIWIFVSYSKAQSKLIVAILFHVVARCADYAVLIFVRTKTNSSVEKMSENKET